MRLRAVGRWHQRLKDAWHNGWRMIPKQVLLCAVLVGLGNVQQVDRLELALVELVPSFLGRSQGVVHQPPIDRSQGVARLAVCAEVDSRERRGFVSELVCHDLTSCELHAYGATAM